MGIIISLMACQSRLLQKTNLLWQAIACKETARPVIKGAAKGQLRKTSWNFSQTEHLVRVCGFFIRLLCLNVTGFVSG